MKITFANDTSLPEGDFKARTTHEIDNGTARSLILRGKAVAAASSGSKTPRKTSAAAEPTSAAAETTTPAKGKGKE